MPIIHVNPVGLDIQTNCSEQAKDQSHKNKEYFPKIEIGILSHGVNTITALTPPTSIQMFTLSLPSPQPLTPFPEEICLGTRNPNAIF